MTNLEFDRYSIERMMKTYSADLLSAFHSPDTESVDIETKRNSIARAQSMLNDIEYLNKVAASISEQIKDYQRKLSADGEV